MANAAGQIWPHLQSGEREPVQQSNVSIAAAMYPSLAPKPAPRDLAAACDANPWLEVMLAKSGIRRKRGAED